MRVLPDPYVLAFLLAVGLVVLLCYNRLVAAVGGSLACYRGTNGMQEMLGNTYVVDSVRIVFLLLLPFLALSLTVTGLSGVGYWWTLAALLGLWLFRKLVYATAGWLVSRRSDFRNAEQVGYAVGMLMLLGALVALLLAWLVPATPRWLLWGWLGVCALVALVVYALRGFSLFSHAGFSPYLWVLYLCGLEVLPISVVVNILIHGN